MCNVGTERVVHVACQTMFLVLFILFLSGQVLSETPKLGRGFHRTPITYYVQNAIFDYHTIFVDAADWGARGTGGGEAQI